MVSHVNTNEVGIYCERIPNVSGKKKMDNMLKCFVRMKPETASGEVGRAPAVGSMIQMHTNNEHGFKCHLIPQMDRWRQRPIH